MTWTPTYTHLRCQPRFSFDFLSAVVITAAGLMLCCGEVSDSARVPMSIPPRHVVSKESAAVVAAAPAEGEILSNKIESLATSKILMDRAPSSTKTTLETGTLPPLPVSLLAGNNDVSSPSSPPTFDGGAAAVEGNAGNWQSESAESEKDVNTLIAILVAQCRATCLAKFNRYAARNPAALVTTATTVHRTSLRRLTRQRRFIEEEFNQLSNLVSSADTCFLESSECLSCWKNCQLFATSEAAAATGGDGVRIPVKQPEVGPLLGKPPFLFTPSFKNGKVVLLLSSSSSPPPANEGEQLQGPVKNEVGETASRLCFNGGATGNVFNPGCNSGCQAACSFYKSLLPHAKIGEASRPLAIPLNGNGHTQFSTGNYKCVVRIFPGKISWRNDTQGEGNKTAKRGDPVVYVVIQEDPDGKWRQIVQTTHSEINIPTEFTAAMKDKLGWARVLVVGPSGLRAVYVASAGKSGCAPAGTENMETPRENKRKRVFTMSKGEIQSREKLDAVSTFSPGTISDRMGKVKDNKENNIAANANTKMDDWVSRKYRVEADGEFKTNRMSLQDDILQIHVPTAPSSPTKQAVEEMLVLRLVSLIHQNVLVIAELRWEEIGNNPTHEYLITWELTGGGLKGHLVTDSASVTLSLWPDTLYHIQVEQRRPKGESKNVTSNYTYFSSRKSSPLLVDTSVASFPLRSSYAHLRGKVRENEDGWEEEEDYDSDMASGEEDGRDDNFAPGQQSIIRILGVTFLSFMLVLVIFTLVALIWAKLRLYSGSKACQDVESVCCSVCEHGLSCYFRLPCVVGCETAEFSARLVGSQQSIYSTESGVLSSPCFYSSPQHYALSLRNSQYLSRETKVGGGSDALLDPTFTQSFSQVPSILSAPLDGILKDSRATVIDEEIPVAIISSSSLTSTREGDNNVPVFTSSSPCSENSSSLSKQPRF